MRKIPLQFNDSMFFYSPMNRILQLNKQSTGQFMYRVMQGEIVLVSWQYGTFDRASTIEQAFDRFGKAEIVG